jgi:hypothetical protein
MGFFAGIARLFSHVEPSSIRSDLVNGILSHSP